MRINVVQAPRFATVDGIELRRFVPGQSYEVGNRLGALFLAEGWAVPVVDEEPALVHPTLGSGPVPEPHHGPPVAAWPPI